MKFIAFYLPQYHTIPENDKWWGEGFTEWIRVKNAKPLFNGHNQPRIPLNENYYDLSDVDVMKYQAKLAREYGIHGFCYYHYWFNGKLLLEKPLEQMLNDKEVDIPFCFSWANEPWTQAWAGKSKEILIGQSYGNETDWEKHLNYLVPFFSDERYIKVNGMPVFLIYRTESFDKFDKMIEYWNQKLLSIGLSRLYVVEMLTSYQKKPKCKSSDGVVEFEPMFTIGKGHSYKVLVRNFLRKKLSLIFPMSYKLYSYDNIWQIIINRNNVYKNKCHYPGAFTDWDNTPRFKNRSAIFKYADPEKFHKYLLLQVKKSKSDFVFINAWNEWAEGAYLEPDRKYGDKFLQSVKKVADECGG